MLKAQFGTYEFNARKAQNDTQVSLWDLIERYKSGRLIPAPHQRNFVWTPDKVNEWAKTIIEASRGDFSERPTGFMVTYQVPNDDTIYLNDGLQRLTASMKFLEEHQKYKLTPEQAAQLLINFDMPVQHRQYRSQERALIQFQRINFGTPLTNAEFCAGFLGLLENSDTNWQPTLDELHKFLDNLFEKNCKAIKTPTPEVLSLNKRHNYVLFYYFLSKSKTFRDFAPLGFTTVNLNDADQGRTIEQVLRKTLDNLGIEKVLDEFENFKKVIREELNFIISIWDSFPHKPHNLLTISLCRYLLTIALWVRNNGGSRISWRDFLALLLPKTFNGSALIYYEPEDTNLEFPKRKTLGVTQFVNFKAVSKAIGSSFYDDVLGRINIFSLGLQKPA